eukprot:TRINITY_DN639_c0_g1_i2.p1 TRINITY_DN639_c0_g1~~TRINITY_DN639_c0_g1_i2.p1  ORF type:complete len:260 (+),score=39.35 TRINITY_DN639_c0_g1_i2:673-1452(+)
MLMVCFPVVMQPVCRGYATFVAIDAKSKRPRPLPSTSISSAAIRPQEPHISLFFEQQAQLNNTLSSSFSARRKQLSERSSPQVQLGALEHLKSISFKRVVHVAETQITIRKHFLPRHLNYGGVVFGGDILQTLENAALSCASRMQQKPMRVVAVRSVSFVAAVQTRSMFHVVATAIACTRQTVIILIRAFIDQENNRFSLQPSHSGVFYVAAQDAKDIEVGVHVWGTADEDDLHRVLSLATSDIVPSFPGQAVSLSQPV